ncbi:MAG: DUF3306 domain-containing protein [Wenzhouxiangella sp.]|nr:MAG: DUF3306 domain-containing protein [Wenzhouxiangella sp.]
MSKRETTTRAAGDRAGDESFLERWSRRKQGSLSGDVDDPVDEERVESAAEDGEAVDQAVTEIQPESGSGPEPEPPGDEDMPPLESIDQGGSVAAFFSPNVSASLRRAALRRLFKHPEVNSLEALDDYAEDYRTIVPLGATITADMRYRAEQARKLLERKLKARLDLETDPEARAALLKSHEEALAKNAQSVAGPPEQAQATEAGEADSAPTSDDSHSNESIAADSDEYGAEDKPKHV